MHLAASLIVIRLDRGNNLNRVDCRPLSSGSVEKPLRRGSLQDVSFEFLSMIVVMQS
jgi:hypothetical protein